MAFTKVASLSELPEDQPARVDIGATPLCLVRLGDEVKAIHDTCSHQEFSLSEGLVFMDEIECSLHGSMFSLEDGSPSSLPATTAVPVFATKLDGDAVLVDLDQQLNDAPWPEH
ncbi:MAG TPA: non-heme iron oxygenase ferredoxin subunit [Nitriliruptorales bacterium]